MLEACHRLALTEGQKENRTKKRRNEKLKMSKFRIAVLALICALICAIVVFCIDIWKIKAELDHLYWIAENTHSGMVGAFIERAESLLHQRLMFLTILWVALIIMSLIGIRHQQIAHKRTSRCLFEAFRR